MIKFSGISKRTNHLVSGDLIQDETACKYYIASGWEINQDSNTHEFTCFDCEVLEEVNPETITFEKQ